MTQIVTFTLLIAYLLYVYHLGKKKFQLPAFYLPLLFVIKMGVAAFFLYVYTYEYGGGLLTHDAGAFLKESKILHDVYASSPSDYFTFLFGQEPNQEFVNKYLANTNHWSSYGKPLFNDSQNVIRFNSLVYFISQGWDFTHVLFGSIISFTALLLTFSWVKERSELSPKLQFLVLFLLPSLLFWSSSFLKEPFMIFGFALVAKALFHSTLPNFKRILYFTFGLLIALMFKPYVLFFLLIASIFFFIYTYLTRQNLISSSLIFLGMIGLFFVIPTLREKAMYKLTKQQVDFINVGAGGLHIARNDTILFFTSADVEGLRIENNRAFIDRDTDGFYVTNNIRYISVPHLAKKDPRPYEILYRSKGSASHFEIPRLNFSWKTFLLSAPTALSNSFFRPFILDEGSWLMTLAKLENLGLLLLTIFFLWKGNFKNNPNLSIILTFGIFIFLLMLIIGYTTPVSGAIVRYKIPAELALGIIGILSFKTKAKT